MNRPETLHQQFRVISSLPNYHKWMWDNMPPQKQQVKFEQKFCSSKSRLPSSPRNRIVNQLLLSDDISVIRSSLLSLIGFRVERSFPSTLPSRAPKKTSSKTRPIFDVDAVCESLGISQNDRQQNTRNFSKIQDSKSFYLTFVERLMSGVLAWRVLTESKEVVVMNDYDCQSGEFKV